MYLHMWSQIASVVFNKVAYSTSKQVVSSIILHIASEHTSVCRTYSRFRGRKMPGEVNNLGKKPPIGKNVPSNIPTL